MLPKENRLKNTRDIENVFGEGRGVREGFLFLKSTKNGLTVSRFAFIASKKSVGKAAHRNKIKRILRSVVQQELSQITAGFDAVVVVQKAADKDLKGAAETMRALIYKAKLLN